MFNLSFNAEKTKQKNIIYTQQKNKRKWIKKKNLFLFQFQHFVAYFWGAFSSDEKVLHTFGLRL